MASDTGWKIADGPIVRTLTEALASGARRELYFVDAGLPERISQEALMLVRTLREELRSTATPEGLERRLVEELWEMELGLNIEAYRRLETQRRRILERWRTASGNSEILKN